MISIQALVSTSTSPRLKKYRIHHLNLAVFKNTGIRLKKINLTSLDPIPGCSNGVGEGYLSDFVFHPNSSAKSCSVALALLGVLDGLLRICRGSERGQDVRYADDIRARSL